MVQDRGAKGVTLYHAPRRAIVTFMPALTPELEQRLLNILTDPALGWMLNLHMRSPHLISERLGCSIEDARLLLRELKEKDLIESVSESGGRPAADRALASYGWKWIRRIRYEGF